MNPTPIQARLTTMIDQANAMIPQMQVMLPAKIVSIQIAEEWRVARIHILFDDGTDFVGIASAAMLSPWVLIEAVHRVYLIAMLGLGDGEYGDAVETMAYGTGQQHQMPSAAETHPAPDLLQ